MYIHRYNYIFVKLRNFICRVLSNATVDKIWLNQFLVIIEYYEHYQKNFRTEAEFKEFQPWLKFEMRIKYGWFHSKFYSMFQDLSRRSILNRFLADLNHSSNSLNSFLKLIIFYCWFSANVTCLFQLQK